MAKQKLLTKAEIEKIIDGLQQGLDSSNATFAVGAGIAALALGQAQAAIEIAISRLKQENIW